MSMEKALDAFQDGDVTTAVTVWTELCLQGNSEACYRLALCYVNGDGVDVDHEKAKDLFHRAAEGGYVEAQYSLGVIYEDGLGDLEPDGLEAAYWYTRAADQKYPPAMSNLAGMYETGEALSQDYAKAIELYSEAAERGYIVAIFNLGVMFENGNGIEQDFEKAARLYEVSAKNGLATAMHNLGVLYASGAGVPEDVETAKMWFNKAAEHGYEMSRVALKTIEQAEQED